MKQEILFPIHISDKGLISKIHKKLIFCSRNRKENPIKEWAEDLHRHTDAQQVHKNCSVSLIITEMKIKTSVKYHLTCVRMIIIEKAKKKKKNEKSW